MLATKATLSGPSDIAFDGEGNLHIADTGNQRIRRVDKYTGIITTIAGTGDRGYTVDGSSALSATFSSVSKIAFDAFGDLFILDDYRVRKITTATGILSTVAGNGEYTYQTGGAPAIASSIGYPTQIACDPAGNLFILDVYNEVVWRVARSTGIMTVAFGNRLTGVYFMGKFNFLSPTAMTLDAAGDLYLTDRYVNSVMKVTLSTGVITLFGPPFGSGESMFVDASGNIYYMEISIGQVRKITVSTGVTTIVARNQYFTGSICADSSGKIYVAGKERNAVFLVPLDASPQVVTAPTPYPTPSPPSPTLSPTAYPTGVQIGSRSIIAGVDAGVDEGGYNGDGILATTATLLRPEGIMFDGQGHLFIADSSRKRRADKSTGIMTTVAGAGEWTGSGDGGLVTLAVIGSPERIVFDVYGDMYFSETFNYRIRKVTTSTGIISTAVGTGEKEYNGENILGTSTSISQPGSIACDSEGNLYYTDSYGGRIRKLTRSTGLVNTIAGSGVLGNEANLDNVVALNAIIDFPRSLVIDASGDFYFVSGCRTGLRKLTMSTGILTTIKTYDRPNYLFIDKSGNIYYTTDDVSIEWKGQHLQGKIFKIAKSSGLVTMVANNLGSLSGFYVDDSGDIYVTEYHRSIVIKISQGGDITKPPTTPPTIPPSIITAPPTRPPVTDSAPPTRTSTPPPTRPPVTVSTPPTIPPSIITAPPTRPPLTVSAPPTRTSTPPPTRPPVTVSAPPTRTSTPPATRPPVTDSAPPTRTSTPPPTREPTRRPTCMPSKRPQRRRPSKAPMRKPNRG
jgi:streptogramin lyase